MELTFTKAAAWRDIYPPNFVRPREYKDKPPGKSAENLIPANEKKAVSEQEAMVMGRVKTVIEKLQQQIDQGRQGVGEVVDLLQWFNYAFFDIIGEFNWSSSFSCLEQEKEHPWIQIIAQFKITIITGCLKYYSPLDSLLQAMTPKSAMADLWMIWRTTEEKISRQMERPGNNHRDVMSHMLAADQAQMTR
ncbi:MAG: hypothetical protein Q9212_005511 [Teloschistes hypoglaucus]